MKLFTARQISQLDNYTIENEPISDVGLMERASMQITNQIVRNFSIGQRVIFFAGPGNNGGDALAMARQLAEFGYQTWVYIADMGKGLKGSPEINRQRLIAQSRVSTFSLNNLNQFPDLYPNDIVVDGLFGSGLNRPLDGFYAQLVKRINQLPNTVISIDIPSGLSGEDNRTNNPDHIIHADYTYTFQFPKISFFFSENQLFCGKWETLPIGLHPLGIQAIQSSYYYIEKKDIIPFFPPRNKFSHKGSYGHALLIAGSYGKIGASVMASRACLRAGAGLLTVHTPKTGNIILQTAVNEAMVNTDVNEFIITDFPDLEPFSAIGVGPGTGTGNKTAKAVASLLEKSKVPLVIDADGLNILSERRDLLEILPANSILTPHPGEFRRLAGEIHDPYERLELQIEFSKKNHCIIVLKGAHSIITTPQGQVFFNSTGNPGMATAGSGDVLTGVILGLLAQGFGPENAAVAGVYLHGLAGDLAAAEKSQNALMAGDITEYLGKAFLSLQNY
jgi:NAD(P)H-hydrate epimerase